MVSWFRARSDPARVGEKSFSKGMGTGRAAAALEGVKKPSGRAGVLIGSPGRFLGGGPMIFDRRNDEHPVPTPKGGTFLNQGEIIRERLPPASARPGDSPADDARLSANDRLGDHPAFVSGPSAHAALVLLILGDDGSEHYKAEPGLAGLLGLFRGRQKLAGRLSPGVPQPHARVRAGKVGPVGLSEVGVEAARQAVVEEPMMVLGDPGAERPRQVGRLGKKCGRIEG